jgi:hypothetical protein
MTLISVMVTVLSGGISVPRVVDHPLLDGLVRGDLDLPGGHGFPEVTHVT